MATILPFETRDARAERLAQVQPTETETSVLTTEERLRKYEEHTMTVCRDLLLFYKRTAQWTPECETMMIGVVRSLKTMCRQLAAHPILPTTKESLQ